MEKFKILAEFIKDASSETKDVQTFLFVKDYISKYQLTIDITSKPKKNELIEISTTLKFADKENNEKKSYFEIVYVSIIKLDKSVKEKKDVEKIKLNITAVYTVAQVKKINRCLDNKTNSIISIFSGRMADVGKDPVPIIKKAVRMTRSKTKVEILWASTREPYNYKQAQQLGCQIITMPPKVIEKVSSFGKSFDRLTKDTVKAFLQDSKKSRFKI